MTDSQTNRAYSNLLGAVLLLTGVSCTAPTVAPPPAGADRPAPTTRPSPVLSGDAVFLDMLRTYEGVATYEEKSTTTWRYSRDDGGVTTRLIQSDLVFDRPARMRLRYWVRNERFLSWGALWWNDSEIHSQRSLEPAPRKWESIHEAASVLSGVSDGLTNTIPLLLIGRHPWSCRGERPRAEAVGREAIGAVECEKLRLLRPPCLPVLLWVAETTHLLIKLETRQQITEEASKMYSGQLAAALPPETPPDFRDRVASSGGAATAEQTTVFQPRVGTNIDATRFTVPPHIDASTGP